MQAYEMTENGFQDKPGGSKDDKAMDAEKEAASAPSSRNRSHQGVDRRMEDNSNEESNVEQESPLSVGFEPLPSVPRQTNSGRSRQLNYEHTPHRRDYYHDASTSSNISVSSRFERMYLEPIYVAPTSANYPNIHQSNDFEAGPHTYNNEESFIYGHWILFTNVARGWSYSFMKAFLRRHLGLKCHKGRPVPRTQPAPQDFRIFVTFISEDGRDRVLQYLRTNPISRNFMYSVVDSLPVGSFDSDSGSDDDESVIEAVQRLG